MTRFAAVLAAAALVLTASGCATRAEAAAVPPPVDALAEINQRLAVGPTGGYAARYALGTGELVTYLHTPAGEPVVQDAAGAEIAVPDTFALAFKVAGSTGVDTAASERSFAGRTSLCAETDEFLVCATEDGVLSSFRSAAGALELVRLIPA